MILNLVLFSGIYYMKVKNPDHDFLALKLNHSLLADEDDDDEVERGEGRDNYNYEPHGRNSGTNQQVSTAFDRTTSFCSDSHMENMEKVRSLSFV